MNNMQSPPTPGNEFIYCDIPYKGTTKYKNASFCHEDFYEWARLTKSNGHSVYISEYERNVPPGFEIVWAKDSKQDMRNSNGEQRSTTEILMTPK